MEELKMYINEQEMNKANPQWKKVSISDLSKFPHNCIGSLTTLQKKV
jgi:hypothetical protein